MANASAGNAYVPGGAGGGVGIAAGGATQTSGTVVFSNSNGVTFGYNNGTITATVTPGAAAGIAAMGAGTQTATSGTQVFSNSNNVSFGMSGSSQITASANVGVSAISAGTTSVAGGAVVLSNSNGLAFGLNGSTITGSYTVPGATVFSNSNNVTFGLNGSTVTASISVPAASSLSFSNANGVSFGTAGSTLTASVAAQSSLSFSNLNGVSFGIAGSTLTASVAAGGGSPNVSAGTTSGNLASIVFSNSNGVSFGLNGSTITASASGAGASGTILALGNTTAQSSSNTMAFSAFNVSGSGVVSVGMSGQTLVISAPGTTNFANLSVSAGTTSNSLGSLVFSNSNGVSFGLNGSTITASAAAGGGAAISAGTQSTNGNTVVFSNSNGISFGMSNSSIVTASYTVPTVTQVSSVGLYALGNTTQNSSTTLDQRTMSFNALGAMTMGYSNGSIQVSAPATSSLVGVGGINISTAGSTISVSGPGQLSFLNALPQAVTTLTQIGNGSVQVYPFYSPEIFSASRADILISQTVSSSSNSSHAGAISVNLGLYTRNGSTLSLASSGSQSYQWTNTSNNSMGSLSGLRRLSVPFNVNYSAGGDLWVAVQSLTTSTNANWFTASNLVLQPQMTAQLQGLIGAASNNTNQLVLGEGIWSTTSAALPASIAFSAITGLGSAGAGNNVYMAPVYFANATA